PAPVAVLFPPRIVTAPVVCTAALAFVVSPPRNVAAPEVWVAPLEALSPPFTVIAPPAIEPVEPPDTFSPRRVSAAVAPVVVASTPAWKVKAVLVAAPLNEVSVVESTVPVSVIVDAARPGVVPMALGITLAAMIDASPVAQPWFVVWLMMSTQCRVESLYSPYCVDVPVNAVPSVAAHPPAVPLVSAAPKPPKNPSPK